MNAVESFTDGLVSVITPLYNGADYIIETILSVQNQTYPSWEMLIVDDGSTDDSREKVERYLKEEEEALSGRVRLFQNEKNLGIAKTRNFGLSQAKGRYIAFLDSDDLWDPTKLEVQLSYMQKEDLAFCYGSCRVMDEKGNPTGKLRKVPREASYESLLLDNYIPCLTVVADRYKISTEKLKMPYIGHEDYAAWLNVFRPVKGEPPIKAYGIESPLASYRVNTTSTSGNKLRAASWHFLVLREQEKLSFIKACGYMVLYLYYALKKRV
ncbi:MAG: glycosyltransferase [Lachnospiraceae bacterium]|nr:glycosyltransferase [Lachnospiraceae bacterium]